MQIRNGITPAFFGGEATPEMAGRIDKEELRITARYIKNFVPACQGGLKKFWGTWFITRIAMSNEICRLIPISGMSEPMSLFFFENRVYKVTKDEVIDQNIPLKTSVIMEASYSQNNAVIYFAAKQQSPFYLRYDGEKFSYHVMSLEEEPFFPLSWSKLYNGAIRSTGYQGEVTITPILDSTTEYSLGLPANLGDLEYNDIVATYLADEEGEAIPFAHLYQSPSGNCNTTRLSLVRVRGEEGSEVESEVFGSEIGNQTIKQYYRSDGVMVPSAWCVFRSVTFSQVMATFSSLHPTNIIGGEIRFLNLPAGHKDGDRYYIKLTTSASGPGNYYLGYEETDYYLGCKVEGNIYDPGHTFGSIDNAEDIEEKELNFGTTDILGMRIRVHLQTNATTRVWAKGVAITANQVYFSDGKYYKALATGTAGDAQPTHTSGIRSDGNIDFEYMHDGYGFATITAVPDSQTMIAQVDGYLPISDSNGTHWDFDHFQWSQWGYKGQYPDMVFDHSGRLGYIFDTDEDGSWLQTSKSDDYYDFGVTENGQTTDVCGINVLITGHPDNHINWILSAERLYMGSYSGEYKVSGADSRSNVITPTSLSISPVSAIGGAKVTPIRYKRNNIFVSSTSQLLYTLQYSYQTDDYSSADLSTYGEELLSEGVADMGILKNKEGIVYFRTNAGNLRYFNYEDELKQLSFFRADLNGKVLASCISESAGIGIQFVVVKRDDGVYIEYIDSMNPSYCLSAVKKVMQGPFEYTGYNKDLVCCCPELKLVYPVSLMDGMVTGIPLATTLNKEVIVGSKMECEIHCMPYYDSKAEQNVQKPVRFAIRVLNSGPFSYGSSNDFTKYYEYEQATNDMTGDILLPSSFGYMQGQNTVDGPYPNDTGVALNIKTDAPLPFNLLMTSALYV